MKREIININEDKCTGCGNCIPGCPEGALQVIDNKARLISDLFCDGLGACIGTCPENAIEIEEREAVPYDEIRVIKNIVKSGPNVIKAHLEHLYVHGENELLNQAIDYLKANNIKIPEYKNEKIFSSSCPGAKTTDLTQNIHKVGKTPIYSAELKNWPVQLQLLNPNAPYLKKADLLISADCAPFAYPNFHQNFLKDKILIIFCPKLDKTLDQYVEKLTEIFNKQEIRSISIVHMEVPCCSGIESVVRMALDKSNKSIPIEDYTISINGGIV